MPIHFNNKNQIDMNEKKSPSETIQSYLFSVQAAVNSIIDPTTLLPVQIPDFNAIYDAAGRMDTAPNPSDYAVVITSLLGRAAGYDCDQPGADYQLSFPNDHHLHPTMGAEWYYVGCHLNVTDSKGNDGRLGILLSIQKNRCVGKTAQHEANWSDTDTVICANVVTVTVDMANGEQKIVRRTRNCQWALTGGNVSYSAPGDDGFWFRCGNDSISGSLDVLPLNVIVDDGDNINMNLTLTAKEEMTGTPYFLQGMPSTTGNGGTGLTLVPKPGIYYSWPQLNVAGSITVEGIGYTIKSGTGWIDHQLLMGSLQNADGLVHPVPFVEDPMPQDGWTWQFYNLNNGDAFTGASFVTGAMINSVSFSYGYYLRLVQGEWVALFIMGNNQLLAFTPFPAPI